MRFVYTAIPALCAAVINASAAFVSSPSALSANDSISWSQMGIPGASIPNVFTSTSSNGIVAFGTLAGGTGATVGKVCPSTNCNYANAPGFHAGDFLLWTEDASGNGTGPLALGFSRPLYGAGVYLELTLPGTFSATLTASGGGKNASETVASDSAGDPVFLGVLDSTADISAITIGVAACTPGSPGGCSPTDFALDSLLLTSRAPEPATWFLFLPAIGLLATPRCLRVATSRRVLKRIALAGLVCIALHVASIPARAQDPIAFVPGEGVLLSDADAARDLPKIDFGPAAQVPAAALPTWRYQLVSPADGYTYGGYMIGTNPFGRGARTTTIPTILVPVIITFQNTTSGFTATFDPSSSPDIGCTTGQTAMSLVENSPIFQNNSWILDGVNAGVTQYVDAFQRANFWRYVQNTGDSYHTLLSYTVGAPLMLTVSYSSPTPAAEVRAGVPGSCGNPSVAGSINGGSYVGIVDINTVHNALARYIVTNGMTPDQLPIFVTYNVVMTRSTQPGFYIGGYHFTQALYPQALVSPGQTYIMADFQSNNFYLKPNFDVSLLSHEVAEWMDDPGGFNFAPAWGHIGQENGCSQYLEVGDPLTGTNLATVPGPNGFLYHLQELAYFSWFFRTPSVGAATMFSDNGTFTTDAGPLCQ